MAITTFFSKNWNCLGYEVQGVVPVFSPVFRANEKNGPSTNKAATGQIRVSNHFNTTFVQLKRTNLLVGGSLCPVGHNFFQHSPTTRPSIERTSNVSNQVSSWGMDPAPRHSHGIVTCSRMKKTAHSGIPGGADLSWIDFTDLFPPFVGERIGRY